MDGRRCSSEVEHAVPEHNFLEKSVGRAIPGEPQGRWNDVEALGPCNRRSSVACLPLVRRSNSRLASRDGDWQAYSPDPIESWLQRSAVNLRSAVDLTTPVSQEQRRGHRREWRRHCFLLFASATS